MKNSLKKMILFIAASLLLCGCGKEIKTIDRTDNIREAEMPFDLEKIEASGQKIEAAYGWGIENYDKSEKVITYTGNELVIDFLFNNVGTEFQAGIMIFIDGIAQTYSFSSEGEKDYIIPVTIEEKKDKAVKVYLTPCFGQDTKEHTIYFASMYNPDYRADEGHGGYGIYQSISLQAAWKLVCEKQENCNIEVAETAIIKKLTKKEKDYYVVKNMDGSVMNGLKTLHFEYWQNNLEVDNMEINAKEIVELRILGGGENKYRLSAFVDNKPVAVFDGKLYEDIMVKDGAKTIVSFKLNSDKLEIKDYSSLYFVLCPLSNNGYDDELMMEKSESLILLQ